MPGFAAVDCARSRIAQQAHSGQQAGLAEPTAILAGSVTVGATSSHAARRVNPRLYAHAYAHWQAQPGHWQATYIYSEVATQHKPLNHRGGGPGADSREDVWRTLTGNWPADRTLVPKGVRGGLPQIEKKQLNHSENPDWH